MTFEKLCDGEIDILLRVGFAMPLKVLLCSTPETCGWNGVDPELPFIAMMDGMLKVLLLV